MDQSFAKANFSIYFKKAITPTSLPAIDFKKPADNSHPWGFTLTIYTPKVQGMNEIVFMSLDQIPGKIYTLASNHNEIIEVDEQFKIILEKIKLYTISQTITVKGTEYSWNNLNVDYSLRFFIHSSSTNPKKFAFLELSSPFVFQDKRKLEQEQQKFLKFLGDVINNTDGTISSLSAHDINFNEMSRYKNYIKRFYPPLSKNFF